MNYLLDTCVISELVKPQPDRKVVEWVRRQDETALFLSVVTIGEIEKGIARLERSRRKQLLRDWVDNKLSRRFSGRILSFDYETASRWGRISGEAGRKGKPPDPGHPGYRRSRLDRHGDLQPLDRDIAAGHPRALSPTDPGNSSPKRCCGGRP